MTHTLLVTQSWSTVKPMYTDSQVIRQSILYLFPVTGVVPRIYLWWQISNIFFPSWVFLHEVKKKWLVTTNPNSRGESLRSLKDLWKERITSVTDTYFTNLWRVGESQGRGAPSIEYRDRQKTKEVCVKKFGEKYDMVTTPSGEGVGCVVAFNDMI